MTDRPTIIGPSRSMRSRARAAIVVCFLGLGLLVGPLTGVRAQEAELGEAEPVSVTKQAYYTYTIGNAAPPILTNQFPPQAVCLVAPDFCSEDAQQITGPVDSIVGENQPEEQPTVVANSPTRPGDLPVALLAGAVRHQSALRFELPPVPEGHEIDDFTIFLTETDPTFHSDSPAFRQTMVALLAFAVNGDSSEFEKIPDADLIQSETFAGVEACPLAEPFEAGEGQSEENVPATNCLLGANGQRLLTDAGTFWAFDLTLAANDWLEDPSSNHGILLDPITPPNAAYGDPDPSTSEQVTFTVGEGDEPVVALETSEATDLLAFGGGEVSTGGGGTEVQGSTTTPSTTKPAEVFGRPDNEPTDRAAPSGTGTAAPAAASGPITAWWVWLLIPIFGTGIYLASEAVTAEAAVGVERSGALTRLLRSRRTDLLEETAG